MRLDRRRNLRRFAAARPVIFSACVMIAAILLTEIPLRAVLTPWAGDPGGKFLEGILEQGLAGLAMMWLLVRLGLFTKARFTPPSQWKALWLAWPLIIMTLLNLWPLLAGSLVIDTSRPADIFLYTCLMLSVGFFEEVLGRGVVLTVMLEKWGGSRRGVYRAVLISSALFGAGHLVNVLLSRLPLLANLAQIVYSFFFAVIFAACVLRNNSIWPMAFMHAAFDFGGGLLGEIAADGGNRIPVANNTPVEALSTIALTLPLLLYGMFILRREVPVVGIPAASPDHSPLCRQEAGGRGFRA